MISPGAISPVGLAWASVQAAVGAIRAMPVLVGTAFLGLLAWAALKTALGLDPNTLHSVMGAAVDTIVTASVVVGGVPLDRAGRDGGPAGLAFAAAV